MDLAEFFVIVLIGIVVLVGIAWTTQDAIAASQCLDAGWADYRVTWNFKKYCVREENEYEITVPWSELK